MTLEPPNVRVTVVIPVYNRAELVARTLSALSAQTYPPELLTVVVADDGSTDDIRAVVDRWDPPFEKGYVRQEHRGFGAGRARNLGARSTESDVVVFLDSDAIVEPDFVAGHVKWHTANPKAVVIGGRLHMGAKDLDPGRLSAGALDLDEGAVEDRPDFRSVLSRRTSQLQATDEAYRAFVSANVSVSSALFASTGGFDERFRWWGSEDSELGWRLWQAGAVFIDDETTRIYHQTDADTAGGAEGRQEARELNRGLLASLVPQRFYRKGMPEPPPEVPKFSVVVHDVPQGAPIEIWRSLADQSLPDFEVLFVAGAPDHDPFAGAAEGERRVRFVGDPLDAVLASEGEYLVFINGHSAPGKTLLQNLRKRLDERPALDALTFGIDTPEGEYKRLEDVDLLGRHWSGDLPLAMAVRRRPLIRLLDSGDRLDAALASMRANTAWVHSPLPLIALPGVVRTPRPPGFVHTKSGTRQLKEAASLGVGPAMKTGLKLAKRRIRPQKPRPRRPLASNDRPPGIRYVGWVGKDNLGDEAMIEAARRLMPWGEIEARGEARDLLLLGGGTLINRNQYLSWLLERDSPRIERAVYGTGVANPGFWGLTEDTGEWLRWLGTCAYVGVRGPRSAQTLIDWGLKGDVEICGDPALALQPEAKHDGSGPILVAPAWTNGELWGGSDRDVYDQLTGAIEVWAKTGREVTLMSCHPSDDRPILMIKEKLGATGVGYHAGYVDVAATIEVIASSSIVVGERLHACVLAAASGRPFIAIEYRPKVRDFAESVAMDDYVIRSDELKAGRIVELATELGTTAPEEMDAAVATYRRRLAEASRAIEVAVKG
ncbi:MAG: glycosyltransferase [Acidimicrobiia bacterium]